MNFPALIAVVLLAVVLAASAAMLAMAGSDELTNGDRLAVGEARVNITRVAVDGHGLAKARAGVATLIRIYRANPDAEYDGTDLDDVLRGSASDLHDVEPGMAARLERAVR